MTVQINGTTGIVTPALTSTAEIVSANGVGGTPCFSAYANATQSITAATWTKINFGIKEFDTTNAFDNVTNMRYTPLVAGYYQVSATFSTVSATLYVALQKNGALSHILGNSNATVVVAGSALVFLNGTTDYIEIWGSTSITGPTNAGISYCCFQAAMIRGA